MKVTTNSTQIIGAYELLKEKFGKYVHKWSGDVEIDATPVEEECKHDLDMNTSHLWCKKCGAHNTIKVPELPKLEMVYNNSDGPEPGVNIEATLQRRIDYLIKNEKCCICSYYGGVDGSCKCYCHLTKRDH